MRSKSSLRNRGPVFRGSIGFSPVFAMLVASQPAAVAAATPAPASIVNACAGVNLPPSVISNILSPILDGLFPLNLSLVTNLLGTSSAGSNVALKANAGDGNAFNSSTCVSQANNFTLTNAGGISIGGNQITGLGNTGATAAAGEINSIAFGNGAVTANTALGSIALGTGSSVTGSATGSVAIGNGASTGMANSVAIGANTSALRGALTGYTGYALGAIQNSAGEVSVGTLGAERQLTNVAAGSGTTDAVNVAQLTAVNTNVIANSNAITGLQTGVTANNGAIGTLQGLVSGNTASIGTLQTKVTTNGTDIATLQTGLGTLQGTVATNGTDIATLQGKVTTNGTAITGLQTGVTANGVAITGLQGSVATNGTDIGALQTGLGTLQGKVTTNGTDIATLQTGLGTLQGTVATNGTDIATLQGKVTTNGTAITGLQTSVTANGTAITGLQTGALTTGATLTGLRTDLDADTASIGGLTTTVGTQATTLTQHTADITANADAIVALHDDAVNGTIGPVQFTLGGNSPLTQSGAPTNDVALVGDVAGAVGLHNVASGSVALGSTDAVNGGQLFTLSNQLTSLGNIAVEYDGPDHASISLGGAGSPAVALHNIATGTLALGSTDAVTGDQLFTTNGKLATLTGRVDQNGTDIADLQGQITLNGGSVSTLTSDLGALTSQVTTNTASIVTNTADIATNATAIDHQRIQIGDLTTTVGGQGQLLTDQGGQILVNADAIVALRRDTENGAIGPVQYSNPTTPLAPNGGIVTNDLTLVGQSSAPVTLHNVADGIVATGSTDAVNGGQLSTLSNQIGSLANLAVQYDDPLHASITLNGPEGAPVLLKNVAAGTLSAVSTDAVNGSQLYDIQNQIGSISDLAVQYDDSNRTRISLGGATPVTLANVADGDVSIGSTQAVNGGQLALTNQSVTNLHTDVVNQNGEIDLLNTQVDANNTTITSTTNTLTQLSLHVSNGSVGPVQYSDAASPTVSNNGMVSQDLTLVGMTSAPVELHNLAAGLIGLGSTDAVNGGQLYGLGTAIATAFGGNYSYNPTTNSLSGSLTYGGNSYSSLQNVLGAIQASVEVDPGTTAASSKYFHTTSTLADSQATGEDSTAIGAAAVSSGDAAIAVGRGAQASGDSAVAIGDGATAQDGKAVSIGVGNMASGDGAVSIGDPNIASGQGATALGKDNQANGNGAIALGNTNIATGDGASAIGYQNQANGQGAASIGYMNDAEGDGAIAIGTGNLATGAGSIAIGSSVLTTAVNTLAIGNNAEATAMDSVTVGNDATSGGVSSTAVGNETIASGTFSSAFGSTAQATNFYALAVGQNTIASGPAATAIGAGAISSGTNATALGVGAVANEDFSVALGGNTETTRGGVSNYTAFGVGSDQNSAGEIAIGINLPYFNPLTNMPTPIGARQITGVAAGSEDTDAVNVAQLRGVSGMLGSSFATYLGGGTAYNSGTGTLSGPSYTLLGTTYSSVGDALTGLADRYASLGSGGAVGTDPNAVEYDDASRSSVSLADNGTTVHNVAPGAVTATSTDAVNGSQLNETNVAVSTLAQQVQNGAVGVVQYSSASSPTSATGGTRTNDATLVGANAAAPVALHNVADGNVTAGSTDAVNGGQLAATNAKVATAQSTADQALAMGQTSVQYDSGTPNSVTLGGSSGVATSGAPVALHNVADATSANDAVNLGQLQGATSSAIAQSNAYTDQRISALSFDLAKVHKDANAGTAGAMALTSMPQPYEAGKGMIAMGMATYQGQSAVAVGVSKAMEDGRTVMKMGATYDTRHHVGASVGIGYQI